MPFSLTLLSHRPCPASQVSTGIGFLDHMLTALGKHGRFDLRYRESTAVTSA